ncbi:MAG: hypothetical protein IJE89_02685 [Bacilli bacterium]|nr:hypothetical protein [Bacilli bacterium]
MKNKIQTIIFIVYIFIFPILGIVIKDKEISVSERRKLSSFPEYTLNSEYINKIDKYLLDHFPGRDNFRSLKANFNYNILKKLDNNNIYLKDNYIFKSEYPTNKSSISKFISNISKVTENLNKENDTYIMIIPDKNYYLKSNDFLHIDYNYIYNGINKLNIKEIDIRNVMTLEDYYETDTHWRQEKLDKVIYQMSKTMNFNYQKIEYQKNIYNDFYGVYYGESAINRNPEDLIYLTNDNLNEISVKYLENKNLKTIYNLENLTSLDSYEVFLDGASSYIEIYNNNSQSDKELVIFRDSFASSITPLLTEYYKKITLIDNRYISSTQYNNLIDFTNQDILFMYSTLIVNNSSTLKG